MMNPTKAGLMPSASPAFCTELTNISLMSATNIVTAINTPQGRSESPGRPVCFAAMRGAHKQFFVRNQ